MAKKIATTIDMLGNKITGLPAATQASDAVRFDQLGTTPLLEGEIILPEIIVKAASTANITALSGPQTIDGVALVAGDYCLAKNQSTAWQNGVYKVNAGAWTYPTGYDSDAEFRQREVMLTTNGTSNKTGYRWRCVNITPINFGVTSISYSQVPLGLGTTSIQACPGNDSRLSDTRPTKVSQTTQTPSAVSTVTWALTSGSELLLNLGSATAGAFTLVTSAPTAGSTNWLTASTGVNKMFLAMQQYGVQFTYLGVQKASGTSINLGTLAPNTTTTFLLKWQSATLCQVSQISNSGYLNPTSYDPSGAPNAPGTFDASTMPGTYYYNGSTGSSVAPYSGNLSGVLEVFRSPDGFITQLYRPNSSLLPTKRRWYNRSTWSNWEFESDGHGIIPSGNNLSSYANPGQFTLAGQYADSPWPSPSESYGVLHVLNSGYYYIVQIIYAAGWNGVRMRNSSDNGATWTSWANIYG